jgi:uncharacterized protein (TIGR03067 family)
MVRLGAVVAGLVAVVGLAVGGNPPPNPPDDLAALQGNWKPLSIKFEDKDQMTAAELQKVTAVFDQKEYHLYYADKAVNPPKVLKLAVANVVLDPSTTPKGIEFTFAAGPLQGQKCHGVYDLAGNQLKLCYGPADRPRPTGLAAPTKSGYFLEVWGKQPTK